MFDAVVRDLIRLEQYLESYLTHSPEMCFLILGGALLVLGWLVLRSRRS